MKKPGKLFILFIPVVNDLEEDRTLANRDLSVQAGCLWKFTRGGP